MSFATYHDVLAAFFNAKFHSYVLAVYPVCISVFSSFSFFAMSSMYLKWLIFSCNLLSLYLAVQFLCMWFSGIVPIINSRVGMTVHLGKSIFGSLFQPGFFLLLLIQLSSFSCFFDEVYDVV